MIKGLAHFNARQLSLRHLKVMLSVEYLIRIARGKTFPTAKMVGRMLGLHEEEFESELRDLVESRYLHEKMPTYGNLIMTYKLGATGGTLMRQILPPRRSVPDNTDY